MSTGLELQQYKEHLANIQEQAKQIQAKANQIERLSNEAWKESILPNAESHRETRFKELRKALNLPLSPRPNRKK